MQEQLTAQLLQLLNQNGIKATADHASNGENTIRISNDISLMVLIEVYHQPTGDHETIPADLDQLKAVVDSFAT